MGGMTGTLRRLLLGRIRAVMTAVAVIAVLLIVASYLVDEGEIVEVKTVDALGRDYVTEVWIVDLPDGPYLRARNAEAGWLARAREAEEIIVTRDGNDLRFRAVPESDDALRDRINVAMGEKYGFADEMWQRLDDHDLTVPVRLLPVAGARIGAAP